MNSEFSRGPGVVAAFDGDGVQGLAPVVVEGDVGERRSSDGDFCGEFGGDRSVARAAGDAVSTPSESSSSESTSKTSSSSSAAAAVVVAPNGPLGTAIVSASPSTSSSS